MEAVDIYRGSDLFVTVKPNDNSSQVKKTMGDNTVSLSFELDRIIDFRIGDYTAIYGEVYSINTIPTVKKLSAYNFQYDGILQSTQYTLNKAQYLGLSNNNTYREIDFSVAGIPDVFMDLLLTNLNRVDPGWTKGGVIQVPYQNITFSKENCFEALKKIASTFGTEYYIEGRTIHLTKQQNNTRYDFQYGSNRGLYNITRTPLDLPVITRLYAFGGTTNIPTGYRDYSQRLLMPDVPEEHLISSLTVKVFFLTLQHTYLFNWTAPLSEEVKQILVNYRIAGTTDWTGVYGTFTGIKLVLPNADYEFFFSSITATDHFDTAIILVKGNIATPVFTRDDNHYLELNTSKYGIIEGVLLQEDIFPDRVGKVTSVDATNFYKFKDNTIDFNVNDYLLPGVAASLTFNTGQLAGYTFDISAFDNGLQEFTILKNKDEKTIDVPSVDLKPAINDEYVLTDITLPQSYITDAEQRLYEKAVEYLQTNSEAQFNYTIDADEAYFKNKKITIQTGDVVGLDDIDLQVSKRIRVIGFTRSLVREYQYTFELGETIKPSKVADLLAGQGNNLALINRIRNLIAGNRLLSGTNIGNFTVEQGGLILRDAPVGTGTPLYLDSFGQIVRGG